MRSVAGEVANVGSHHTITPFSPCTSFYQTSHISLVAYWIPIFDIPKRFVGYEWGTAAQLQRYVAVGGNISSNEILPTAPAGPVLELGLSRPRWNWPLYVHSWMMNHSEKTDLASQYQRNASCE